MGSIKGCVAAVTLAALGASAHAQADVTGEIVASMQRLVDTVFELDDETKAELDEPLRSAAEALRAQQLPRATAALRRWVNEALAAAPGDGVEAARAAWHRLINETALWRTQVADPAHEAALAAAWANPSVCRIAFDRSVFARAMRVLKHVPEAQRAAALRGEGELLARWGDVQATPVASPLPQHRAALRQRLVLMRAGTAAPQPSMPPVLVARLVEEPATVPWPTLRCLLQQWWLQAQPAADEQARAQAFVALRYAVAPRASDWLSADDRSRLAKLDPKESYPGLARRFQVQGETRMAIEADERLRPQRVSLVERRITVPGVPAGQAVAFDDLLDEAALAKARTIDLSPGREGEAKDGVVQRTITFVWKLQE